MLFDFPERQPCFELASDLYPVAHFRAALIGGILSAVSCYSFYNFDDPIVLIWAQFPGMILFYLLAYIPQIKRLLLLKSEMDEEVYQRALEVYHDRSVSLTQDRTGILLYISTLEKRVHILADVGINSKVEENYWEEMLTKMIAKIKKGKITSAMEEAISECGEKLSLNFPIKDDDTNEIDNSITTS